MYFRFLMEQSSCCSPKRYHGQKESYGNLSLMEDHSSSFSISEDIQSHLAHKKNFGDYSIKETNEENIATRVGTITIMSPDDSFISIDDNIEIIWEAIESNDIETVMSYIINQDINTITDSEGLAPLHRSVIARNLEITQVLIGRVNIDSKDNLGRSALHYSCIKNYEDVAIELIKHGAAVNILDDLGKLPEDYCKDSQEFQDIFMHLEEIRKNCYKINSNKAADGNLKVNKVWMNEIAIEKCPKPMSKAENGNQKHRKLTGPADEVKKESLINNFKIIKVLHQNTLGEVYLIQNTSTKEFHSMKVMIKEKLFSQNLISMIIIEKKILTTVKSPFINPLICSFQTHDKLIMVNHFCSRGSLFNLLGPNKTIDIEVIKLYTSEIILALECLHENNFVYLNLTPSNILINNEGHLMLTDFSLSKQGINEENLANYRGSLKYAAPEIIQGNPYGYEVDWYMLGLIVYEMATGMPYLYEDTKIEIKDPLLKNFINSLLENIPWKRLGFKNDSEEVKNHEFLNDIDWEKAKNQKIPMPIPKLSDTSNQLVELIITDENTINKIPLLKSWTYYNNS